jgi:hypothetical protein
MTRGELEGAASKYSRRHGVDAEDLADFAADRINDVLDKVLRTLYLCQADRCDHCEKKIRVIEGFKIR